MHKRLSNRESESQFLEQVSEAIKKSKGYASFWDWPNRPVKECGIVCALLEAIENETGPQDIRKVRPNKPDPPDCIGLTARGERVAIEVTELVDQTTVELNRRGSRTFKQWLPDEFVARLEAIVRSKDSKKFHGGPYAKVVLVIHTDEPLLSHLFCKKALHNRTFGRCKTIADAYLILSDVLAREFHPFIRLNLPGLSDVDETANLAQ